MTVTVHVGKIQDKTQEFYEEFQLYILGLDSIEARRYMNDVACSFLGKRLCTSECLQHYTLQLSTTCSDIYYTEIRLKCGNLVMWVK